MKLLFISSKGSLDPIALLRRSCDDTSVTSKKCPSWVPHWHALDGVSLRRQLAYLTGNAQPFRTSPLFRNKTRAAGDSTFLPGFDNGVLTCQGMLVGRVAVAGLSTMNAGDSQLTESSDLSRLPIPYSSKKLTFRAIYCNFLCIAAAVNTYDVSGVYGNFHDRSFRQAYLLELLRIWRSSYNAGFDPKTQTWINAHRTFTIHGRTIESRARWMMWTLMVVRLSRRAALDRYRHLLAGVRHFIAPYLACMAESGMRLTITDKGHIGWAHQRDGRGMMRCTY